MGIFPHAGFRAGLRRGPAYSTLRTQERLLRAFAGLTSKSAGLTEDHLSDQPCHCSDEGRAGNGEDPGPDYVARQAPAHRGHRMRRSNPDNGARDGVGGRHRDASEVARNRVIEPESSAQKPSTGRILVMRWPIVLTMRQPPNIVPRPIVT